MDAKRHALLARRLIKACGGLDECSQACRVKRSTLSLYCDPHSGAFMPADVICDLESYCGDPIYSRALFENRPAAPDTRSLVEESLDATEAAAGLQATVRRAVSSGRLSSADRRSIDHQIEDLEEQLRALRAAADKSGGAS